MPTSLPRVEISKLKNAILSKSDAVRDDNGKVVAIAEWIRAENRLPKLIEIEHEDDFLMSTEQCWTLWPVWSDLGLALRMRKPELDVIRESHPQSSQRLS
eukprot:Em0046g24a